MNDLGAMRVAYVGLFTEPSAAWQTGHIAPVLLKTMVPDPQHQAVAILGCWQVLLCQGRAWGSEAAVIPGHMTGAPCNLAFSLSLCRSGLELLSRDWGSMSMTVPREESSLWPEESSPLTSSGRGL